MHIGVLDSGMGGLSVLDALIRALPGVSFTYTADHAGMPWGDKSVDTIRARTKKLFMKLLESQPDGVVFACNTATLVALEELAPTSPVPLFGVRPQDLLTSSLEGPVGVMATQASINNECYQTKKAEFMKAHPHLKLWDLPCPGLMEFVERGELSGPLLEAFLRAKFQQVPVLKTCLLSCTHYPFLRPTLEALNPNTTFLDPSLQVVLAVCEALALKPTTERDWPQKTHVTFWSTDPDPTRDRVLSILLPYLSRESARWQKF